MAAFYENNYGNVAVQNNIPNGRRTFCFSYALSKLDDGDFPNTKEELMHRLLIFFDIASDVEDVATEDANRCKVYPNPTSNGSTLNYYLVNAGEVSIEIVNSIGQKVGQLYSAKQGPGEQNYFFETQQLPAGVYYYSLRTDDHTSSGKIIVMK